jgi:hypothetical protein
MLGTDLTLHSWLSLLSIGQTLATVEASSEINTDCELGSKHSQSSSSHRDLQAIDSAWLLPETQTTFDSTHPQKSAAAKWDQFEVNRRLYNVPDTFDEKFYTKVLDPTTITKEQRDHAEKLAHLIEKTVTNNVHLKEERGQIDETEDEENWNEEDRFSGVIRQADPPSSPSPSPGSDLIHGADKVTNQNQTDPGVKRDLQLEIPGDLQEVERQQEEEESVPAPHLPDSSLPRSSSSASLQMLTPSALRASAVEFIPTPTLKQDSQPPKPNLSPRANPPTITALPVSVGKPKGKSRKSKSSPSSSLPSPKSDTSSIISTPEPMASFNTAQSQQFPPFPSQQTMYPQQQPPHPHYQMHPPPPQPMYFHPSQQMGYPHMAPFGMPQMGMGMGPPIMFPVPTHGTHYPQFQMPPYAIPAPHPHPQMIPPYGYPPLGPGPPPGSGQYPMPYPFYPPQSFPPHFMPPAPHSHVMDPNVYHHAGVQPNPQNTNTG